jgi:hypothetical protein
MKLCTDCKLFSDDGGPTTKCSHIKNLNPADGKPDLSCYTQRIPSWIVAVFLGMCGESGRWFEQKPIPSVSAISPRGVPFNTKLFPYKSFPSGEEHENS